jgi:4-amino-4-deoxy-L-arabinose transferase-like glycosyltransferase
MAFVYASFYLVQQQRPASAANLNAFASVLLDLGAACAILAVGAGVGHRLCHWLGVAPVHPVERLVLSTGVGLGALSFLVLGIGLLGWLTRWVVALVIGVVALTVVPDLVALGRTLARVKGAHRPRWLPGVYTGATFSLSLLAALAPPTDWDGLFYHLTLPRLYIQAGRIVPVTDMPHQYFPGLVEMLYTVAMLLRGDVAAKLLHYGFMLLLAGIVYLLARRHVGREVAWLGVTMYAAIPMVPVLGSWAYNDLALVFYQVAALYALANWSQEDRPGWLALSAVCCGLAMGCKYTSVVCPLVIVLWVVWRLSRAPRPWQTWAGTLGLFCGVVLLVASPWYARNLALTGNPVYPFAYRLFGGLGWDDWRAAWYARAGSGLGRDWFAWLRLPWTLTLGIRDMNFYDGRVGPLFLLGLPFLIAWLSGLYGRGHSRPPAIGLLVFFALAQYLFWAAGVIASRSLFQSRLLLPALVALCSPLAYVYDRLRALDTPKISLFRLVGLSVALVLAANLCYQFLATVRPGPMGVLVGEESREAYLERNLGAHYAAMELVNARVPEDGRVLFLWEPRSYYSRVPTQPDPILERWPWLVHRYGADPASIADALAQEGYTHVLLHRAGLDLVRRAQLDPLTDVDVAALDAFTAEHTREQGQIGAAYTLYEVLHE